MAYKYCACSTLIRIMFIIRLIFIVSALFFFLVFGLFGALLVKMFTNIKNANMREEIHSQHLNYPDDGKTIQGEYKILDETHKD